MELDGGSCEKNMSAKMSRNTLEKSIKHTIDLKLNNYVYFNLILKKHESPLFEYCL